MIPPSLHYAATFTAGTQEKACVCHSMLEGLKGNMKEQNACLLQPIYDEVVCM